MLRLHNIRNSGILLLNLKAKSIPYETENSDGDGNPRLCRH